MDSYLGDLADIVRATSTTVSSGFNNTISNPSIAVTTSMTTDNDRRPYHHHHHHQPPAAADWTSFHANSNSSMEFSSPRAINQHPNSILSHDGDFGDPFSSTRDPLLEIGTELDAIGATTTLHHTGFFSHHERSTCAAAAASDMNMNITGGGGGGGRLSGGSCRTEVDGKQRGEQKMAAAEADMKMPTACSDSNHTNIFSRILQISPSSNKLIPIPNSCSPSASTVITSAASPSANIRSCTSTAASASALPPAATAAAAVGFMSDDDMINNNPIGNCTPAAGATAALQISSPRNPGIKRRKSQAKKVVCIPAPAATNSRQGGEVVPSDLWAWRKYGQKPIKGSPYPRGYYRCSSSKGCSARKQVERSRTDPNMLVITYTSEHNHPWPTQRNALAGSTRTGQSSSSKSTSTAAGGNSPAAASPASAKPSEINARVSVKQGNSRDGIGDDTVNNDSNSNNRMDSDTGRRMDVMMTCNNSGRLNGTGDQYLVKEEVMLSCVNKGGDDDDVHQTKGGENEGHREGLHHQNQLGDQLLVDGTDHLYSSYRPIMPGDQCNYLQKQQQDDPQDSFFADLGELEADPLTLLFRGGGDHDRRDGNNAAAVAAALLDNDPFSGMFDWVAVHNNDESSSSRKL